MRRALLVFVICLAFVIGFLASRLHPPTAFAAASMPSSGWTLHIDAQRHFGASHSTQIAHHWCKGGLMGGILECQIYDSDAPNARLVEVETIVPTSTWKQFSKSEQAVWHYHRKEIPLVHATLPGMPPAQQKKVVASMLETYGKVWLLWNPLNTKNGWPTGTPSIVVLPGGL
ncbi:MAG TPA: DUF1264 domain-containing protein [Candidatus Rubrimentiphilum sp.]|nr:DUF1264 domain-containing protein [Candidatus Rubrimentiphilum sp.]